MSAPIKLMRSIPQTAGTGSGIGGTTGSDTSTVLDNLHKIVYATNHDVSGSVRLGSGIATYTVLNGTSASAGDIRPPYGSEPVALYLGGGPSSTARESLVYEEDTTTASGTVGTIDGGTINLSLLSRWETRTAVSPRYMGAWTPSTRVPQGTVINDGAGNYYIQQASGTSSTGTVNPTWDSTPDDLTTEAYPGNAVWYCVGTTRPILTQDCLLGITDCVDSGLTGASAQCFSYLDPTASHPNPYNFIGFCYRPEPISANGNVGDVHWMAYAGGVGMTPSIVDTGVTPDNLGASQIFTIRQLSPNTITYFIDNVSVAVIAIASLTAFASNPFWSVLYRGTYMGGTTGHIDPTFSFDTTWFPAVQYGLGALMTQSTVFCSVKAGISGSPSDAVPYDPGVNGTVYTDGTVEWLPIGANTNSMSGALCPAYVLWETSQ